MENYYHGAATALFYMAELGASKEDIFTVAATMDITFEQADESDQERIIKAFGDLNPPEGI